jgi:2-methylisocitrate lyase-like PEP mutase family enzyme
MMHPVLEGREPLLLPGVWDALSVLLAADAGFRAVFVSGYAVSATVLGRADRGYVTQTDMADVARRVCAAAPRDMAVIVDADTGYGNALNTIRTVELWEQAGAAGIFLEDQVWPKRCGHMAGKAVVERDEWLAKLSAALDHRQHLHVTARTDARAVHGLDEALERGRMARDLGVNAVFVEAPETVAELEAIAAALPGVTLVANMVETGRTPLLSLDELSQLGFGVVLSPLTLLYSATVAMQRAAEVLRTQGTMRAQVHELIGFDDFARLVGAHRDDIIEQRYGSNR